MNVTMFTVPSGTRNSISAANLPMMQRTGLKSAQDKAERRQKAQNRIAFWENRKESLKNMKCGTLEDIAKKLALFQSYESEIAAVKTQYNQEQMWHAMDEAKEIGEKIAGEAEKFEPKTARERREDMAKEAHETDGNKGGLPESMEEMQEETAEMMENMSRTMEEVTESVKEAPGSIAAESMETTEGGAGTQRSAGGAEGLTEQAAKYKRIDIFI